MPFLPLGDDNKRRRIETPWITWGLIFANFCVFILQQGQGSTSAGDLVYGFGLVPAVLLGDGALADSIPHLPAWATLVSYQFLHGGWDHLLGNMLFLWIFGDNVEDAMGHLRFLLFYLLGGIAAGLAHALLDPGSPVPLIGASGAISAVLGAYLLLHPFARIIVLVFLLPLRLPAWVLLLVWFGFQFVALGGDDDGVAWTAHIAGFLEGAATIVFFKDRDLPLWGRTPPTRVIALVRPRARPQSRAPSAGQRPPGERRKGPGPWG